MADTTHQPSRRSRPASAKTRSSHSQDRQQTPGTEDNHAAVPESTPAGQPCLGAFYAAGPVLAADRSPVEALFEHTAGPPGVEKSRATLAVQLQGDEKRWEESLGKETDPGKRARWDRLFRWVH